MIADYTLPIDDYNIKNILMWGLCQQHFYQVGRESRWHHKVVHIILGTIEIIPVAGQIVALLEWGVVKFFTYNDVVFHWPENLNTLDINDEQKRLLHRHLTVAMRLLKQNKTVTSEKRHLTLENMPPLTLPLSVHIEKTNDCIRIILLPRTVFMIGGERKIRWAYDLTRGEFLLKKRVVGMFEEIILKEMLHTRNTRGITCSIIWRTILGKQNKQKRQMIESLRHGTILSIFNTEAFLSLKVRCNLILDFLKDLRDVHKISISGVKIGDWFLPQYYAFHADVKMQNALVFQQNGRWRGELCDFGKATSNPMVNSLSVGFTSPECVEFYNSERSKNMHDNVVFNMTHGQHKDIWAMGMLILAILVGRVEKLLWLEKSVLAMADIAPLPCLMGALSNSLAQSQGEMGILQLNQDILDRDVDLLRQEVLQKNPQDDHDMINKLFMTIKEMLRINPRERKNICDVVRIIKLAKQKPQAVA